MLNAKGIKECLIDGGNVTYGFASLKNESMARSEASIRGFKEYLGCSHTYYINGAQQTSVIAAHFFK